MVGVALSYTFSKIAYAFKDIWMFGHSQLVRPILIQNNERKYWWWYFLDSFSEQEILVSVRVRIGCYNQEKMIQKIKENRSWFLLYMTVPTEWFNPSPWGYSEIQVFSLVALWSLRAVILCMVVKGCLWVPAAHRGKTTWWSHTHSRRT